MCLNVLKTMWTPALVEIRWVVCEVFSKCHLGFLVSGMIFVGHMVCC